MSYTFYDISTKKETTLDLKNCTITGNSSAYQVKDGKITKYSILDGKIDKSTAEDVQRIELTNYQLALFGLLKGRDDNPERFDAADLKDLSPDNLKTEMNKLYKEKNIYNAISANIGETNVELSISDTRNNSEKKINIEFEQEEKEVKKEEKPGFFKRAWNKICSFFGAIKNFFTSKKEENEEVIEIPIESLRTTITPAETITVGENDEHNAITLSNDLGISFTALKLANPDIDLDKPINNGTVLNIPERKSVNPGFVTNIEETAEAAGVSPEYVNDILFKIEGKNGTAAIAPYDDMKETIGNDGYPSPIKGREKKTNGTLTIGFGHTGRVFGQIMTKANKDSIRITENQAYELLAADIINAKTDAELYYGEAFTNAPQSIQDAIVDIIFNKGLEKGMGLEKFDGCKTQTLTPQIKQCLENKDYTGCISKLIYNTGLRGLHKRNYYRLISAMRDLPAQDRQQAMQDIEYYYNDVCKMYKKNHSELKHIQKAWENAQNGICSNFMD